MDPKVKQIWTTALRSGEYEQTHGVLKRRDADGKWGHCCLGVLCDEAIKAGVKISSSDLPGRAPGELETEFDGVITVLPPAVQKWAGLDHANPDIGEWSAASWNDYTGKNFNQIADLIDEHL